MKYQVILEHDDIEFDSKWVFRHETPFGADDAVTEFLKDCEGNSHFCEGYPKESWVYKTKDESGNVEEFKVVVDFEPQYYVYVREPYE